MIIRLSYTCENGGQRFDRVIGYAPLHTDGILGLNLQISTP